MPSFPILKCLPCFLIIFGFSFLFTNCTSSAGEVAFTIETRDTIEVSTLIKSKPENLTYNELKSQIKTEKQMLRCAFANKKITMDSVQQYFTQTIVNRFFPYWYGTNWSFEGHTATPNKGEIGCGYFVSATLKDMGLNVNRYRLAQQNPLNEAQTIQMQDSVLVLENPNSTLLWEKILKEKINDGLYFVGLDVSHVGYLYRIDGDVLFIHSNPQIAAVCAEKVDESIYFNLFQRIGLAEISTNKKLLTAWLYDNKIEVKTTGAD